jgi:hypothetical protein
MFYPISIGKTPPHALMTAGPGTAILIAEKMQITKGRNVLVETLARSLAL